MLRAKKYGCLVCSFFFAYFIHANDIAINHAPFDCEKMEWTSMSLLTQIHSKAVIQCLSEKMNTDTAYYHQNRFNIRYYLAKAYGYQSDYRQCAYFSRKALQAAHTPDDSIHTLLLLSKTYRTNDNTSEAQSVTTQALDIATNESLQIQKALTHIELARIFYDLKDSLKAVNQLFNAKNVVENSENHLLKGEYYYQKARVEYWHERHTDFDNIIQLLFKSLDLFTASDAYFEVAATLDFLGSCHIDIGEYTQSGDFFQKSLSLKNTLDDIHGTAISYNNLGDLAFQEYKDEEALQHYNKSIAISQSIKAYKLLDASYYSIASLFEENNDSGQSIHYLRKKIAATDSLRMRQREDLLYDLQTQYETREKEQTIQIQEKELQVQRQRLVSMSLVAIFLSLIAGLIYFLYHQKNRLNKIITQQKDELQDLNTFKNRLFSIVGHDLRGMMSKLDISQEDVEYDTENQLPSVSKMGGIIDRLKGFVENILYWGFANTDRLSFQPRMHELEQIVKQVAYNFKYDLEHKNITLTKDIPHEFSIRADLDTTKVVLRNLLANAIKYSENNSEIIIKGQENGRYQLVQIIDNGQGIPPEKVPMLFDINPEKITKGTAGEKGTGLGLWLCKTMMEKNEGKIEVHSTRGEGTSFTLYFPSELVDYEKNKHPHHRRRT